MKTDNEKIMLVHDALAECKGSDKLYLLIYEHYRDQIGACLEDKALCHKLIGALVCNAIESYEAMIEAAS